MDKEQKKKQFIKEVEFKIAEKKSEIKIQEESHQRIIKKITEELEFFELQLEAFKKLIL